MALEDRCGADHPFTARAIASLAMFYESSGEPAQHVCYVNMYIMCTA
jgi:hypothetical protein